MYRIGILVLAMASLAASDILTDRSRLQGIGLNSGLHGLGAYQQNILSRDDLLKQKFILEVLEQIQLPVQNQELLQLGVGDITNEDLYMQPLDEDMIVMLNLLRTNQVLGKNMICNMSNVQHIRQLVGLYRLFLNARDFQSLQRVIVYARQNINTELFVNSLVMALAERSDTRMLIIPALYEILPQLYQDQDLIEEMHKIGGQYLLGNNNVGVSSMRPNLLDIITMGGQHGLNSQIPEMGGMMNILNKSQFWMPWRNLHQQLGMRKLMGLSPTVQHQQKLDKIVISQPITNVHNKPLGLFTEDLSLKSYFNILIDEVIVKQGLRGQVGRGYQQNIGMNVDQERDILGDTKYDTYLNRDKYLTETRDRGMLNQRRGISNSLTNTDNTLYVGRRGGVYNSANSERGIGLNENYDLNEIRDRDVIGQRRYNTDATETEDRDIMGSQQDYFGYGGRGLNRVPLVSSVNRMDSNQDKYMLVNQQRNYMSGQRRGNSVSLNDNRLLFSGRRRKNLSGVPVSNVNVLDDYTISGGRRVSKDEQNYRKSGRDERREKYIDEGSMSYNIHRSNNDDDDNVRLGKQTYGVQGREDVYRYGMNDDTDRSLYYQNRYGQGGQYRNSVAGRGRNDFLSTVYRDNTNMNDDTYYNKNIETGLPTTTINDERLLPINRRRLNEIDEGRRVGYEEEGDRKYVDRDGDRMRGGRIGGYQEEGDRKYVDRYGDRMRGGRIGIYQEEGDRKYVDTDRMYGGSMGGRNQQEGDKMYVDRGDDSMRGYNNYNRYLGQDNDYQDRQYQRKESDNYYRYRRSLDEMNYGQEQTLNGKLLLHNLQQLAARINIERISLGQSNQFNDYLQVPGIDRYLTNDITTHSLGINRGDNVVILQKINDISQRLDAVFKQQISRISGLTYEEQINEIGLMVARQILDVGLLDIFGEVLNLDQHQEGHISNILENPLNQLLLCRVIKIVDNYIKDLHQAENILLRGVTINNIKIDKLQTYLEYADVDLTNLVQTQPIQRDSKNMKMIVGRIPRLNHKTFNIKVDVTSDRQQTVVIRTFLGPKIDSMGNTVSLKEQRQNYILLDINTVDLKQGENMLKLKSNDITWTTRDTTSYSEIYERVMRALDGDMVLTKDLVIGQNNLFPHRLLIPRGRINGLPMQLLTVITSLDQSSGMLGRSVNGLDSLLVDRLPLNYPLDGDIQDVNGLISMPNLYLTDVMIYHEDHIKLPLLI